MIHINQSKTADTRTCDVSKVTKEQLLESSVQHIGDVKQGMGFFAEMLIGAAYRHDLDKITDIDTFHRDFQTGFKVTEWWDRHRKINRHHLLEADGVPEDVNLIDVLDMIVDCVMAGLGRSGTVRELNISPDVLMRAYNNTAKLLEKNVVVDGKE